MTTWERIVRELEATLVVIPTRQLLTLGGAGGFPGGEIVYKIALNGRRRSSNSRATCAAFSNTWPT